MSKVSAANLPQSTVSITVVHDHPDYDAMTQIVLVARDWRDRGEEYVRKMADVDANTVIFAVLPGAHQSLMGCSLNA